MTPLLLGNQVISNRFDPINNFKKGKGANEPKAQMAGDYPGFLSMKLHTLHYLYGYEPPNGVVILKLLI